MWLRDRWKYICCRDCVKRRVDNEVSCFDAFSGYGDAGAYDKHHRESRATEKIGLVELATISFGQSFQITPIQLATTVSSIINGGNRVTPHVGMQVENGDKKVIKTFDFPVQEGICREETSEKMRFLLEKVVSEGGGNKAYIEGYEIGGKTATSQTLPRSAHKYISSFLGFAPADDPKVLVLVIIRNPSGIYYGGTIAAPVAKEIFENILPYLELEQ